MLELFINYDMASDRIDLFQKILATLASIAQGSTSEDFNASQKSPTEMADLRFLAMQGVITLTRSLASIIDAAANSASAAPADSEGAVDDSFARPDDDAAESSSSTALNGSDGSEFGTPAAAASSSSAQAPLSLVESYDLRVRTFTPLPLGVYCNVRL
jgi:hypothetical protein